jgi:hypothetical protein
MGTMTAAVLRFPIPIVCVAPAADGVGWLLVWRARKWIFGSHAAALAEAHAIAAAHGVRVIDERGAA